MKTEPNDTINPMTMDDFQQLGQVGLTKREYFAGLAMQGLVNVFFDNANAEAVTQWQKNL